LNASIDGALVIGIRDSGVGGLTVARCIRRLMPHASLLYFADTAHVPYGDRSPAEVRHFALSISEFLLQQGAQMLVFACNTSSAYALDLAREKFDAPLVGMIEPGARAALQVSTGGPIGVLATQATVDSEVYPAVLESLRSGTPCFQVACPEFVPLVEGEQTESTAARRACRRYLEPLLSAGAKTIILGCTHYPLLLPLLREEAPDAQFVDPAEAVALEVLRLAGKTNTDTVPRDTFFVSGATEGVRDWIAKLLGNTSPNIQHGPVFDAQLQPLEV
jgi:glutamate racemase